MIDMQEYWAMIDHEIAQTPMPEEYRDMLVQILCKDCHKVRPFIHSFLNLGRLYYRVMSVWLTPH